MLEELLSVSSAARPLRPVELRIVEAMIARNCNGREIDDDLRSYLVEDLHDGGMGSIRFLVGRQERRFEQASVEAEYIDDDGVKVSIALNVDEKGKPYELDFWKADFSSLQRYPAPSDLRFVITSSAEIC